MSVSWPQLLPAVVVAVAVLLVPGAVLLRSAGIGWLTSVLAAPVVSTAVIVAAWVVMRAVGVSWTAATGVGAVLVVIAAGLLATRAIRLRWPRAAVRPTAGIAPLRTVFAVGVVSLAAAYLVLAGGADSPMAIPQMPDVVFHLGAVEWMVRHGSASALDVYQYAQLDGPLSYPGVFHAVTAATAAWTGLPVIATWHAMLIVVVGLVWPFGVMLLARVVLGRGNGILVAGGLLTLVFSSFPTRFLAWGPLWSNLLANALLPAVLAGAMCAVAPSSMLADRAFASGRIRAVAYAALGVLVLLGTQPNAVASGVVVGCAIVAGALPHWRVALDRRWAERWVRLPWFLVGVGLATALSIVVIPAKMFAINAHVRASWAVAGAEAATLFDGNWLQAGVVLALVVMGAVRLARDRRRRWAVASLAAFVVIFLALYAVNGPIVRLITWLWWNDHYRVQAVLVLPAVLCATAGAVAIGDWLARRRPDPARVRQGLIALVAVTVVVALRGGIPVHRDLLDGTYREESPEYSWVLPQEYAALAQLAGFVPAGAVVAANPYRGGMFLYVAGGVEVLYPTENSLQLPDRRLLGTSIQGIENVPAVCAAARRQRVDYVLTGGDMHIWGVLDHTAEYAGVDATANTPAFEAVAHAGPYTLRRVPTCTAGTGSGGFVGPVTVAPLPHVSQAPSGGFGPASLPSTAAR